MISLVSPISTQPNLVSNSPGTIIIGLLVHLCHQSSKPLSYPPPENFNIKKGTKCVFFGYLRIESGSQPLVRSHQNTLVTRRPSILLSSGDPITSGLMSCSGGNDALVRGRLYCLALTSFGGTSIAYHSKVVRALVLSCTQK